MKESLNYGQAIQLAKEGKAIARKGWNGKNMFVFLASSQKTKRDEISLIDIIPYDAQELIKKRTPENQEDVEFLRFFCMYTAQGNVVPGWLASQTDMLADDWTVVEV